MLRSCAVLLSILLKELEIDSSARSALAGDYERFAAGLPEALEEYVRDRYEINLSSEYGGLPIKNPFGKASGQLSLNVSQVPHDAAAGIGVLVLKKIIEEKEHGAQCMSEMGIQEKRLMD